MIPTTAANRNYNSSDSNSNNSNDSNNYSSNCTYKNSNISNSSRENSNIYSDHNCSDYINYNRSYTNSNSDSNSNSNSLINSRYTSNVIHQNNDKCDNSWNGCITQPDLLHSSIANKVIRNDDSYYNYENKGISVIDREQQSISSAIQEQEHHSEKVIVINRINNSEFKKQYDELHKVLACPICLSICQLPAILPCGHSYCKCCILEAIKHKEICPICKLKVSKRQLLYEDNLTDLLLLFEQFDDLVRDSNSFYRVKTNVHNSLFSQAFSQGYRSNIAGQASDNNANCDNYVDLLRLSSPSISSQHHNNSVNERVLGIDSNHFIVSVAPNEDNHVSYIPDIVNDSTHEIISEAGPNRLECINNSHNTSLGADRHTVVATTVRCSPIHDEENRKCGGISSAIVATTVAKENSPISNHSDIFEVNSSSISAESTQLPKIDLDKIDVKCGTSSKNESGEASRLANALTVIDSNSKSYSSAGGSHSSTSRQIAFNNTVNKAEKTASKSYKSADKLFIKKADALNIVKNEEHKKEKVIERFNLHALVDVLPRTWSGINKIGGTGRVVKITPLSLQAGGSSNSNNSIVENPSNFTYDVKYVLDNNIDHDIPADFVVKHVELDRSSRKRKAVVVAEEYPIIDDFVHSKKTNKKVKSEGSKVKAVNKELNHSTDVISGKKRKPLQTIDGNTSHDLAKSNDSIGVKIFKKAPAIHSPIENEKSINIVTSGLDEDMSRVLEEQLRKIMNTNFTDDFQFFSRYLDSDSAFVDSKVNKHVTHLIVSVDRADTMKVRTMKYMKALMAGVWVVSTRWISDSVKQRTLLPEHSYEVCRNMKAELSDAPRRARENVMRLKAKDAHAKNLYQDLSLYFFGSFPNSGPKRSELELLLTSGDGKILSVIEFCKNILRKIKGISDKKLIILSSEVTPLSDIEKELKKVLTNSELIQSCSGFKKSFSSNAEVVYIDIATASSSSDSSDKQSSSSSSNTSVLIPIHIITTNWLLDSTTNYQLREMSNYSHPQIVDIQ